MQYVNFNINCSLFKSKMVAKFLLENDINFMVKCQHNYITINIIFNKYSLARNLEVLTCFLKNKNIHFVANASDNYYTDICNY